MPDSRTVLPAPKLLDLIGIRATENAVTLDARTSSRVARCPECSRYRTGLRKTNPDTRMRAVSKKQGGKRTLYGRHRLEEARDAGYVFVVEGESDAHTLWYYGKPCVAVPGAQNWDDSWSALLEGVPRIYVFVEPDAAGEKLWKAVSNCPALKDHVRRVVPE
jgi:hypothetical protein